MHNTLPSLICLGVMILAGCSDEFWAQREQKTLTGRLVSEEPTITWAGVTNFLIDDARSQVLFDGFFSRPDRLSAGLLPILIVSKAAWLDSGCEIQVVHKLFKIAPQRIKRVWNWLFHSMAILIMRWIQLQSRRLRQCSDELLKPATPIFEPAA